MPIKDCPFTIFDGISRPILPVRIINPHSRKSYKTYGIIDTGADDCAIPAAYAVLLDHRLDAGSKKTVLTGNDSTLAYAHTKRFEIFHPETAELLYTTEDTPIDFMPNLRRVGQS